MNLFPGQKQRWRCSMWTQVGKRRVGRTGRLELTYIHDLCNTPAGRNWRESTRSSARALWWPRGVRCRGAGERSQREGMYVYTWQMHFIVQQKLTQHCEAIIFQYRKQNTPQTLRILLLGGHALKILGLCSSELSSQETSQVHRASSQFFKNNWYLYFLIFSWFY